MRSDFYTIELNILISASRGILLKFGELCNHLAFVHELLENAFEVRVKEIIIVNHGFFRFFVKKIYKKALPINSNVWSSKLSISVSFS